MRACSWEATSKEHASDDLHVIRAQGQRAIWATSEHEEVLAVDVTGAFCLLLL